MAKTIGERLRETREQKGLSIEDVAHATRIHANTLRGLEDDDYSGFASTTYAKSFLTLYARHLEIEVGDALEQFSHNDTAPIVSGANYIRSVANSIKPVERTNDLRSSGSHYAEPKKSRPANEQPAHPIVLGMFLLLVMGVFGLLLYAGNKAETPEEALRNITRIVGGDDVDSEGEVSGDRAPVVEIDARPGTRVTPAAPMTRRTNPEPAPAPAVDSERSTPIAQADPPISPKATPISAAPIKARPIVATPVTLPAEEDAVKKPENADEAASDDDATDLDDDSETEAKPKPQPTDSDGGQQGNGNGSGNSPAPGTATTAYRTSQ